MFALLDLDGALSASELMYIFKNFDCPIKSLYTNIMKDLFVWLNMLIRNYWFKLKNPY